MTTFKRTLAWLLVLVMCLSLMPATVAQAEETAPEVTGVASTDYEPWSHGYRFVDILNWDPATDDYSEELVADIPLQTRIDTYAATQANPDLMDEAQLYVISSSNYRNTDTTNGPWNGAMDYEEFSYNVFKFWQYSDITGAGGRPTSGISEEVKQQIGSFEYGTIAIPIAAATNAAHRNGVLSIGEYFVPRNPQFTEEMLYQDENGDFPYAQKLVDIANYYGFDGYFVNQEEGIPASYVPLFRDMIKWMVEEGGLYIQWYDSIGDGGSISYQNAFNDYNDGWLWNEEDGNVANSIFLNYWYSSSALKDSKAHAESLGLDPYDTVFMGVEGGQWKFGTDIESRYNAVDENGQPYTSFAIWGSDWYQDQFDRADDARYKDEYQWGVEERERIYFTSATENAGTYSTGEVVRDDIDAGTIRFQGFSKYLVEKSVIQGTTFASDFNNGHGMQYFVNGQVSRDMEWSNLNIQDILPTWQWWIEAENITLEMDWDYGTKHTRHQGAFPYTQVGAYNGGSSIAVYGDLQESQLINLYKTELDVVDGSAIALTYNKPSADDTSAMNVAVVLKVDDTTTETVYLPIADANKQTDGWNTATVDLSEYAGRTIAAIGVELSATELVEDYQVNLGRLVVSDGADYTPAAPENVALTRRFDGTNEIQLGWTLADFSEVIKYHVYAVYADDTTKFVGGGYADTYYINTLEDAENVVALEVRAVGIDGSESEGARVALASENRVSNILTVSENNTLTVTWEEPADIASVEVALEYWYSEKENPEAVTVAAGTKTATIDIPLEDGSEYILYLTAINADGSRNEPVSYFGKVADNYCEPWSGDARPNGTAGRVLMTTVPSSDWYTLDMNINGNTTTYRRFGGGSNMESVNVGTDGVTTMTITVKDMNGNVSEPVVFTFMNGQPADLNSAYDETLIPDEALRAAIQEKVGTTLGDLVDYKGALDLTGVAVTDLTGLSTLAGVTELNLSATGITELTADMLPPAVKKLTLADCDGLETVDLSNTDIELVLGSLPALVRLDLEGYGNYPLNLTQAPELVSLYLQGTQMTQLDITANLKLRNFRIDDSQIATLTAADVESYTDIFYWVWDNAKLDLSDATDEGTLKNGVKYFFETNEPEDVIDENESVLYERGTSYSKSLTITLEQPTLLSKYQYKNDYDTGWGVDAGTISVSNDGENYTQVIEFSGIQLDEEVTLTFPEGTTAKYVRIDVTSGYGYCYNVKLWGHVIAPKGFTYGGQTPAVIRDDVQNLDVLMDDSTHQLLDLLTASYATTRTLKGTLLSDLVEADWIDAAHLAKEGTAPSGVRVNITDSQGNPYEYPTEGPTLGAIDSNKLNVPTDTVYTAHQYGGEEGYRMFDGSDTSKWCGRESGNWAVFELEEARVVGQWYTMHAGREGNGMISAAFRLQVLNTEAVSEEEYLAMSASEKRSVARSASNWIDLDVVTGNTENEVTREIELDKLVQAQVYRFVVDEAAQPDGNAWGALRVYEMELYAYEGQLGANTNGLLKADTAETYDVTYTKSQVEICNPIQVTVRAASVEDVIALIDAIGTPITNYSRDAIRSARGAYEHLTEEQKALVTNYETLVKAEEAYLALADAVEALIEKIGYVTMESGDAIAAARSAYDALHPELQALVGNCETLLDAEQDYAYLMEVDSMLQQAEEAKAVAEAAQAAAEEARAAAEAAQAAAEEAAASAAADKEAAELAQQKAEAAQAAAEAAQTAAETAQAAAEAAQTAAEEANAQAAEEARKAAASAAEAAQSAAESAASAQAAAEAALAAQNAQAEAEAAQAAAEEAQRKAEEAQKKAEEAAASTAADKAAAQEALAEAEAAKAAALEAQKAAEDAKTAAELAKEEAIANNKSAAESAALAAEYARKVAETYEEMVALKLEMIEMLAKAQEAAEAAEEARKAAELAALQSAQYAAIMNLTRYYDAVDTSRLNDRLMTQLAEALDAGLAAVEAAESIPAVDAAVEAAKSAMDAIAAEVAPEYRFADVQADTWYYDAVDYMVSEGYMNGMPGDVFDISGTLNRGQMVTILYRMAGSPDVTGMEEPFTDVTEEHWFYDAVVWAYNAGIVNGVTESLFAPDQAILRAQMVTMLHRFAGSPEADGAILETYADGDAVLPFAETAFAWAIREGIVNGMDGNTLQPSGISNRAQIAVLLHRYLTK